MIQKVTNGQRAKKRWTSLKQPIIILLLALLLFKVFYKPIESFLYYFLVKKLLSKVASNVWNDIPISILSVGALIYFWCNRRVYTSPKFINMILAFSTIIYLFYRCCNYPWNFTPFSIYPPIKYLDMLLVFCLGHIICECSRAKPKQLPDNTPASFISDEPIDKVEKDVLGYAVYAKMIAEKILISHFEKAFAIGITGKWGLGKSTFFNCIKNNLETKDTIIIDFSPWNSQNPSAIIKDFFETVRDKLKPNSHSLSRSLLKYSESLLSLNENYGTRLMQVVIRDITESKPISQLFDIIDEEIKRLNKKLIIFIDDVDRLDSDEIVEVLRLIRNTANFHNTYFIVAYDRNYVIAALSKRRNAYPHELFLEKIFQLEFTLPHFDKQVLIDRLKKNLKDILSENTHAELDKIIPSLPPPQPPISPYEFIRFLEDWLGNMRDVVRLSNGLMLNIKNIEGEVLLDEFIKLEILRLKFPAVYELLYRKIGELFFGKRDDLWPIIDSKTKNPGLTENALKVYLRNNLMCLSVPKNGIEKIVELVCGVFPSDTGKNDSPSPHLLSVTLPINFDRYFSYQMPPNLLRYVDFTKARRSESKDFNKEIEEWVSQGFQNDIKRYLEDIKHFDDKKDFEKVISAIFHFDRIPKDSKKSREHIEYSTGWSLDDTIISKLGKSIEDILDNSSRYPLDDIISKLDNTDKRLSNSIYSKHKGEEGLQSFIRQLFANGSSPYRLEVDIIDHITRPSSTCKFPLSPEELIEIATDYLKTFCKEHKDFREDVYFLYFGCKMVTKEKNNYASQEGFLTEESKEIFKNYIKKDIDGFLLSVISMQLPEIPEKKLFGIKLLVKETWGSCENFEKFLNSVSETESEYIAEFKELYNKVKE